MSEREGRLTFEGCLSKQRFVPSVLLGNVAKACLFICIVALATLKHNDEGLNVPSGLQCLPTLMAGGALTRSRGENVRGVQRQPRRGAEDPCQTSARFSTRLGGVDGQQQNNIHW